jgi:dTDP-glucose 4,6-dehydratase
MTLPVTEGDGEGRAAENEENTEENHIMKKYLITGCAGFIGSNFVHYMLKKYPEILLVNLDKLTYAGNLENLKDVEGDPRHVFVQGDICDKELVESLFAKYDFDYVINFAAESHVDRSIKNPEIFVQSNVMGTVNLLQRAKEAWYDADAKTWKEGKKYLQVSTDEVYGALGAEGYFMETTPLCPHSPYSSSKASADMFVMAFHDTYGMPINITRCSNNYGPYQFPEKLIPLMINTSSCLSTVTVCRSVTGCTLRITARPSIWSATAARSARSTMWAATTSAPTSSSSRPSLSSCTTA